VAVVYYSEYCFIVNIGVARRFSAAIQLSLLRRGMR